MHTRTLSSQINFFLDGIVIFSFPPLFLNNLRGIQVRKKTSVIEHRTEKESVTSGINIKMMPQSLKLIFYLSIVLCTAIAPKEAHTNKISKRPDYIKQLFTSGITRIFWERIGPAIEVSRECRSSIIKTLHGFREGTPWAFKRELTATVALFFK
jgi:hypothetical protein